MDGVLARLLPTYFFAHVLHSQEPTKCTDPFTGPCGSSFGTLGKTSRYLSALIYHVDHIDDIFLTSVGCSMVMHITLYYSTCTLF